MGRKFSTYWADNNKGFAEVHFDSKNELFYIKYFDENGRQFFTEEYPNHTYPQVCGFAEDWTQGYHPLFKTGA